MPHVVVLVHGIRDYALWQQNLASVLRRSGFEPEPANYGRYDLFRFLVPVPYFRNRAVRKVRRQLDDIRLQYPDAQISVIAHSFGTWVVSRILKEAFNFKFHRIIFCGSVVKYDFDFENFAHRFTTPILNEVGSRDPFPALAESATWGYGSGGTYGFRRTRVKDRWHKGAGHNYFLKGTFAKDYWVPFLENGEIVSAKNGEIVSAKKDDQDEPQLWVRGFSLVRIKYLLIAAALIALFYFGTFGALYDTLDAAFRSDQRDIGLIHNDETPSGYYEIPYDLGQGDIRKILLEVYANDDIAVSHLRQQKWLEFRSKKSDPLSIAATMFLSSAYAQDAPPQSQSVEFTRIAIVQGCSFCIRDNSYIYHLSPDRKIEVIVRDSKGVEIDNFKLEIANIVDAFSPLNAINGLYVQPEQSDKYKKKAENFRERARIAEDERVVALIDATVFGSGKNGVAFGDSQIYVNNGWPDTPFSINYSELADKEIRIGKRSWEVMVGSKEISIPGSSVDAYQLSALLKLLAAIADKCDGDASAVCRTLQNRQ